MINFEMGWFWAAVESLGSELNSVTAAANGDDEPIPEDVRTRLENNVRMAIDVCVDELQIASATGACIKISELFNAASNFPDRPYTYQQAAIALRRLYEEVEFGAKQEFFFHYPRELAKLICNIEVDWGDILRAFPSSRREIETGIDRYALGDYPGCVFHMMRIAELGLRMIAGERGVKELGKKKPKPIQWGTWQEVFDAIESQLKTVRQANPGPKRDVAISYYDTALSDLRTLRGLYRDPTMHFRENYDKGEAYSAIFRVQSLMQVLSSKLREDRARKIPWGL